MNIAHIEKQSFIYGPGCRYVIWTQGCSIRCNGCWNQSMWDFTFKNNITVSDLFNQIAKAGKNIEGITLLGGEPLDQFKETLSLLQTCYKAGLSTVLFTGYEMEEIHQKDMSEITKNLDILITGRYEKNKRTLQHQWIGSTNQKIHFLTDRYSCYNVKNGNYMEISIDQDGSLTVLGFPPEDSF
jgi:anaerobic ribonucleoside-triphosphate reductase activating protein